MSYLDGLSNALFRTAGYVLGERLMPLLAEPDAWEMAGILVEHDTKAFLVTLMKAAREGLEQGRLHLRSGSARSFFQLVKHNAVDVQKTLQQLLPAISRPDDIVWLMKKLGVEDGEPRVGILLRTRTMAAGFVLLNTIRYVEHDRKYLIRVANYLIKQGDGIAFNLASFLCTYYGLEEVRGTFSLQLQPWQLARIENNYEAFCETMSR